MIIVTGGAGFIGSNIVKGLNLRGRTDIVVVDDMTDGYKSFNLADCVIADYVHYEDFLFMLQSGQSLPWDIESVSHQGACTVTTEWDGEYMMRVNFEFSKHLLNYCLAHKIPLVYASSASVYGAGTDFRITPETEKPINVYAWSKLVFDQYVRRVIDAADTQIAGLRYFNVYGPNEYHKVGMASVMLHFYRQLRDDNEVRLFSGCDGFADGEQRRDFIHVDDVVKVNLWLLDNPDKSGIFNLGTGASRTFNDVAKAAVAWNGSGALKYIPFPDSLQGSYQSFTEADMSTLKAAGYTAEFIPLEQGVPQYLDFLKHNGRP
jgi:ADP-L-glycero-D-manno-heptose 6-epimerase